MPSGFIRASTESQALNQPVATVKAAPSVSQKLTLPAVADGAIPIIFMSHAIPNMELRKNPAGSSHNVALKAVTAGFFTRSKAGSTGSGFIIRIYARAMNLSDDGLTTTQENHHETGQPGPRTAGSSLPLGIRSLLRIRFAWPVGSATPPQQKITSRAASPPYRDPE
jgi:hypothetical protein